MQDLELIYNIIKKESESGFKDQTVFGGLSIFIKKILSNPNNSNLSEIKPILENLKDYQNLDIKSRQYFITHALINVENYLKSLKSIKNTELIKKESPQKKPSENNLNTYLDSSTSIDSSILDSSILNSSISTESINTDPSFLQTPLEKITTLNITKRILNQLKKSGIKNLKDLIFFFPRSYSDRTNNYTLPQATKEEKAFLILEIISSYQLIPTKKNVKVIKYDVKDHESNLGQIIFFNQDYIVHILRKGQKIKVFGKVLKNKIYQVIPEEWEPLEQKTIHFGRIVPIYSTSINQKKIREIIFKALKIAYKHIQDPLINFLKSIPSKFTFNHLAKSIVELHFPTSFENLYISRNRVSLEEIIYTQILLNNVSKRHDSSYKIDKDFALDLLSKIKLPFDLTEAQKRVIEEIVNDLSSGKVLRRLVQGDVGAGKTIVAMLTCYIIAKSGYQACLMAPTEILASQHYNNFKNILPDLNIELLTSKIKGKKRQNILHNLKNSKIDILIGTHALIEENVEFKNLALIVVDEQHKFGVNQRFKLNSKSNCPHLMVMSATPIPRTLSLTVYSDLDISVIDQLPPGRKKAITEIFNYKDLKKVYDFIQKQLTEGRQAYIICPSISDNSLELKNVKKIYSEVKEYFRNYQVAYLHGKMSSKEKDLVMEDFRDGKYSILVSTTVVEVGVDVPNANTIVILDAERFGLSQLHQLRGRVKRSSYQPYCLLVTSKNLSSFELSKSIQRLSILKYYDDGFKIAEKDLELRGPGEVLGYKQHGFTEFKVLNPLKDIELIKFSNLLAKKISSVIDKLDFLKPKLREINQKMENITDTI